MHLQAKRICMLFSTTFGSGIMLAVPLLTEVERGVEAWELVQHLQAPAGLLAAAGLLLAGLLAGWLLRTFRRPSKARQEQQLFSVVDKLPWALVMLEDARIVYANPPARQMLGVVSGSTVLGQPFLDLIVPEDRAGVAAWLHASGGQAAPTGLNTRVLGFSGEPRHVRVAGAWVVYGARSMFEIQLYDREAEHSAQAEAEHLASFLRFAPEPVVEVQPDGTVAFLNEAARQAMPDLKAAGGDHAFLACLQTLREELAGGASVAYATCRLGNRIYEQTAHLGPDGASVRLYGRDVTHREEARQALRESKDRFDLLFRISPVGLSITRVQDGCFLEVNTSFARLLGYTSPDELVGRTTVEAGLWMDESRRDGTMSLLEKEKQLDPRVISVRTRSGRVRRVLVAAELVAFEGEPCVVGMMLDVEEREQLRAEVEAERDFARSVIDTVGQGLVISDADFRIRYVNPALLRMTGFSESAALGMDPVQFLHPDDRAQILIDREGRRASGDGSERYEARVQRNDGTYFDALVVIVPRQVSGAYDGTTTVVVDVSEQKEAAREIERLRQFYEHILHDLPLDVAVMDAEGRYLFLNRHAVRDAETRALLIGKRQEAYARLRGRDPAPFLERQAWIRRVIEGKEPDEYEEILDSPKGACHMLRVARPVLDEEGKVAYVVSYSLDITDRKRYEAELIRARDEAEMLSALKSTFIANMSHEVRTPLTAVIGFAEVLQDEIESPQLRELATLIQESGARLLETLNSVLDLARMEAGAVHLDLKATNLVPLMRTTVNLFRPLAEAKGIALESDLPVEPLHAHLDGPAFNRIAGNLLSNAIKFTEAGQVRVEMQKVGDQVEIRVVDTGIGIDPAFLGQVFDEFRQESGGLSRSHTGSGLGLAIVKRLVEMMHGTIHIESAKGGGTTVTVLLPATPGGAA